MDRVRVTTSGPQSSMNTGSCRSGSEPVHAVRVLLVRGVAVAQLPALSDAPREDVAPLGECDRVEGAAHLHAGNARVRAGVGARAGARAPPACLPT